MTESHYLNCDNDDCEYVACVARRDYEAKLQSAAEREATLRDALKRFVVEVDHEYCGCNSCFGKVALKEHE